MVSFANTIFFCTFLLKKFSSCLYSYSNKGGNVMNKDSIIEEMIAQEKHFKDSYILSLEEKIKNELANIFFHHHKFTSIHCSEEGEGKKLLSHFSSIHYDTVSDFLKENVIRFENDNTNVLKLLKDNILNAYSIESDRFLKEINEEHVLECKLLIKGSVRFFAYDPIVSKAFQKFINKLRKEKFISFLESDEEISRQWRLTRFANL